MSMPTPHGEKISALLRNPKLPESDRPQAELAYTKYQEWKEQLGSCTGEGHSLLAQMVELTNTYKFFIEFNLIFLSENDFLYRQKGQLKLDNTILEEFLPHLVDPRLVPGIVHLGGLSVGPLNCFSRLHFNSIYSNFSSGGVFIKTKDQDFSVAKAYSLQIREDGNEAGLFASNLNVAHFVSEIKTNLDKTMFQEAAATARELKTAVNTAKYVLLCEYLDMPPIDTRTTLIDEVIILRKAKRLNSNVRSCFSSYASRIEMKEYCELFLRENPLSISSFERLLRNLNEAFPQAPDIHESEVLDRGWF